MKARKKIVYPRGGKSDIWQRRFARLQIRIQELYETEVMFKPEHDPEVIPDRCASTSKVFFISNDLYVVDNEHFALDNWGPGKYFKVTRYEE